MVELYEESKYKKYIDAVLLAGSIYLLIAAPSIIGRVSENYKGLENKVEYVNTK